MIEQRAQARFAKPIDEGDVVAENAFIADAVTEEEGRHQQHAGNAGLCCLAREVDGIGKAGRAGGNDEPVRRQSAGEQFVQHTPAIAGAEGGPFARGAEEGDAIAALLEETPAMGSQARNIATIGAIDGRQHCRPQSGERPCHRRYRFRPCHCGRFGLIVTIIEQAFVEKTLQIYTKACR